MEAQSSNHIVQLASVISKNTKKFDNWLTSHGIPSPSFGIETPPKLQVPKDIAQARQAVVEATIELQALMLGPVGHLQHQTRDHTNLIAVHAIVRFQIATSLSLDGETSYKQLSEDCGLAEQTLRRVLRYSMTRHIFREPRPGFVSHTATSKALAQIPMLQEYVKMVCEELWPAATRTVEALMKWPESEEPNHTGFSLSNNTDDPAFTLLDKFPDRSKRFANTMSMMSTYEGFEPEHLVAAFPWDTFRAKTFVDIGGSYGRNSIVLAENVNGIQCIVQDLPGVVAKGDSKLPLELKDRVRFMAHDFFREQPVKGADVYFFRWIFHDWSDKYCIKILQCLTSALENGNRIIICDMTLPQPGVVSPYQEYLMRSFDLAMLELQNSKEREVDDWKSLFERADKRYRFVGVKMPLGSKLSFIEVKWQTENLS